MMERVEKGKGINTCLFSLIAVWHLADYYF